MINDMITSSLEMIISSLKYTLCCETFCLNHRKTGMSQKKRTGRKLFPSSNPNSKYMKCKKLCFVRAISLNYIHVQNHTKVIFIAILISFKHNCSQKANIYIEQSRWLVTYPNRDPKASNDVHCKIFKSKRING